MRGIVTIGAKEVGMLANAASPRLYRMVFKKDFLQECQKPTVDTEIVAEMGFIMAMQDMKTTGECTKLTEADFLEWLEGFDPMDTLNAAGDIFDLWSKTTKTLSTPKSAGV